MTPKQRVQTRQILVVDDDPAILALAEMILTERGYEVVTASGGTDALRVFRGTARQFDLLISDVIMPGVSGPTLVEMLLGTGVISKVLLISGYPGAEQLGVLEERLGIPVPVLGKPFSATDLVAKVEQLLRPVEGGEGAVRV